MRRLALLGPALLAGCGPAGQPSEPVATLETDSGTPRPVPSATLPPYIPPPLTSEAEKGEKGARDVLLSWASAMEGRAFGAAYRLFGDYAERTGMTEAEYVAGFADFGMVTVAIGEGTMEGAAGSSYYEVPVTVSDDAGRRRTGTIVLRRVNDVPGATAAQLRWHLERLEWAE